MKCKITKVKIIEREFYLTELINVIDTIDIKIITEVRRSGKSKLLEAFKKNVEANIEDNNIIHINYNLPEYENLTSYHNLYNYVEEHYINEKNLY